MFSRAKVDFFWGFISNVYAFSLSFDKNAPCPLLKNTSVPDVLRVKSIETDAKGIGPAIS